MQHPAIGHDDAKSAVTFREMRSYLHVGRHDMTARRLTIADYPGRKRICGFEGGAIYQAEEGGKFLVIVNETALLDLLNDEDRVGLEPLTVHEFETDADRRRFLLEHGWASQLDIEPQPPTALDYVQYSNLEDYLFNVVSVRYILHRTISAFDFFSIVVWKANRAKSRVAKRLLSHDGGQENLDVAVASLVADISCGKNPRERLSVLIEGWGFRLPMASAILTVLYPDEFSVYDVRACGELGGFEDAATADFSTLWERYSAFIAAVRNTAPEYPSLRDKDRYLWGKSSAKQLEADIKSSFRGEESP